MKNKINKIVVNKLQYLNSRNYLLIFYKTFIQQIETMIKNLKYFFFSKHTVLNVLSFFILKKRFRFLVSLILTDSFFIMLDNLIFIYSITKRFFRAPGHSILYSFFVV